MANRNGKPGPLPTQARLKEILNYDPETGIFTYKIQRRRIVVGARAGHRNNVTGYRTICLDYKSYYEHRLAWLYVFGVEPEDEIDHENGVRDANWIKNLRPASRPYNTENQRRAKSHSTTGFLGVHPNGKNWMAQITVRGTTHHLGTYVTKEEAHEAYLKAKRELHLGCTI